MTANPMVEESDDALVDKAREGSTEAFAVLWSRHSPAGAALARRVTSAIDADDLVSEAFVHILHSIQNGHGPRMGFRPYLYATIRNQARSWGKHRREIATGLIGETSDAPTDDIQDALEKDLAARAFRSLPERWRAVLWYTVVEKMDPQHVAVILGISANSAASLAFRAREGLRRAWVQAHIADNAAPPDCRWTRDRLGEYTRESLGSRETARIESHLAECAECTTISHEARDVASALAVTLVPLVLGAGAGKYFLGGLHQGGSAAGAIASTPALSSVGTQALSIGGAAAPTAAWAVPAIAASVAAVTAVAGFLLPSSPPPSVASPGTTSSESAAPGGSSLSEDTVSAAGSPTTGTDSTATTPGGQARAPTAASTTTTDPPVITSPAEGSLLSTSSPVITGTGKPGATVVYSGSDGGRATAVVSSTGNWSLTVQNALADGPAQLTFVQQSPAGGASSPITRNIVIDTLALPPVLGLDTESAGLVYPRVVGTAEAGSTVQVVDNNSGVLCTAVADGTGSWSCGDLTALGFGTNTISATQRDPAGNLSPSAHMVAPLESLTLDTTGANCGNAKNCNVMADGRGGAFVQLFVDGVPYPIKDSPQSAPSDYVQLNPGGHRLIRLDLGSGAHSLALRYVVPSNSGLRAGPSTGNTVTIP